MTSLNNRVPRRPGGYPSASVPHVARDGRAVEQLTVDNAERAIHPAPRSLRAAATSRRAGVQSCRSLPAAAGPSPQRGFTLVELLVVIGIIGLLVALLLPALNRAIENARVIKCAANLRTLAQAAIMYANENRGAFPPAWAVSQSNGASPPLTNNTTWSIPGGLGPMGVYGFLQPYGIDQNSASLMCPTVYASSPLVVGQPVSSDAAYSYRYNSLLGGIAWSGGTTTPALGWGPLPITVGGTTYLVARPWTLQLLWGNTTLPSNVLLFADYNQSVANERDSNGQYWYQFIGMGGYTSNLANAPVQGVGFQAGHQCVVQGNVVHFPKAVMVPNTGMYPASQTGNFTGFNSSYQIEGNGTTPNMHGFNNVAYADGSVRTVEITIDDTTRTPWPDTAIDPRLAP